MYEIIIYKFLYLLSRDDSLKWIFIYLNEDFLFRVYIFLDLFTIPDGDM